MKFAVLFFPAFLLTACGDDAEKKNNVDRWIREADSVTAARNRIQFVADSTHNADSTAMAEAQYQDSLYWAGQQQFIPPQVEISEY